MALETPDMLVGCPVNEVCALQEAIAAWPKLQASGLRLGSPALSVAEDGTLPSSWIGQFMQQVSFQC